MLTNSIHPGRDGTGKLALNIRFAGVLRDFVMANEGRMTRHVPSDAINHESGERRSGAHHQLPPPKTYQQEHVQHRQPLYRPASHHHQSSHLNAACPERGYPVPPELSEMEYLNMPQTARGNVPVSGHPLAVPSTGNANPTQGWEQPGLSGPPATDPIQAMRMIAQLMRSFIQ
ncbi:hypothetical protein BaRGS_00027837 [Batillaria attramentaria]|uniref:Uncharacterized protein n=1 Tax=Batillaria attramentaria TaxID=370345 RepID=A0ABD0K1P7_9CAEN